MKINKKKTGSVAEVEEEEEEVVVVDGRGPAGANQGAGNQEEINCDQWDAGQIECSRQWRVKGAGLGLMAPAASFSFPFAFPRFRLTREVDSFPLHFPAARCVTLADAVRKSRCSFQGHFIFIRDF